MRHDSNVHRRRRQHLWKDKAKYVRLYWGIENGAKWVEKLHDLTYIMRWHHAGRTDRCNNPRCSLCHQGEPKREIRKAMGCGRTRRSRLVGMKR